MNQHDEMLRARERLLGPIHYKLVTRVKRLWHNRTEVSTLIHRLENDFPCGALLCLPFGSVTERLLQRLARTHLVLIEETPLTAHLRVKPAKILPIPKLITFIKEGLPSGAFVAIFSDHHGWSSDTCIQKPFLGHLSWVLVLEPLYYFRSHLPLLALGLDSKYRTMWDICPIPIEDTFHQTYAEAVLDWVLGTLERWVRAHPDEVCSWLQIESRTHTDKTNRVLYALRLAESLLHLGVMQGDLPDALALPWMRRLQQEYVKFNTPETT